jgi:hypothetical protein
MKLPVHRNRQERCRACGFFNWEKGDRHDEERFFLFPLLQPANLFATKGYPLSVRPYRCARSLGP